MTHKFEILVNGKVKVYNDFDKIPKQFDNVIGFHPVIPPEPHTEEQHEEIEQWGSRLKDLMKREMK